MILRYMLLLMLTLSILIPSAAAFSTETTTFDITKSDRIQYPFLNANQYRTWTNLSNAFDEFQTTTYSNTSNQLNGGVAGIMQINFSDDYYYLLNYSYSAQTTNLNSGGSIQYRLATYCPNVVDDDTFTTAYSLITRSGDLNKFCYSSYFYVRTINTQSNVNDYTRLYDYEIWAYEDGITINVTDIDSNLLDNYTINLYDENLSLLETGYTNTNVAWFNMSDKDINLNYTLTFNKSGYFNVNHTFNYTRNHTLGNLYDYTFTTLKVPVITMNFYDEITKTLVTNVNYSLYFDTIATQGDAATGQTASIYLNETGELEIEYEKNDYDLRQYYLNVTSQTNTTLDLYLLNEGNSTLTNFLITDEAGVNLEGAELSVLRRYIDDGNTIFEIVEMAKSNNNGEGSVYLQQNDATYKFIVRYNGEIIATTNPARIFSNSLIFSGKVGDQVTETLYNIVGLSNTLSYNDANLVTTSWVDSVGVLDELCLYIYNTRGSGINLLNSSCSTANTGSIVLGFNNVSGSYEARVVASTTTDSVDYVIDTLNIKIDNFAAEIGVQGVFWTAVYVIVAATLAFYSPIVAIVLMIIGLIVASFMFVSLSIGTLMLIIAAAGFLLYAFRRGGA